MSLPAGGASGVCEGLKREEQSVDGHKCCLLFNRIYVLSFHDGSCLS